MAEARLEQLGEERRDVVGERVLEQQLLGGLVARRGPGADDREGCRVDDRPWHGHGLQDLPADLLRLLDLALEFEAARLPLPLLARRLVRPELDPLADPVDG